MCILLQKKSHLNKKKLIFEVNESEILNSADFQFGFNFLFIGKKKIFQKIPLYFYVYHISGML